MKKHNIIAEKAWIEEIPPEETTYSDETLFELHLQGVYDSTSINIEREEFENLKEVLK